MRRWVFIGAQKDHGDILAPHLGTYHRDGARILELRNHGMGENVSEDVAFEAQEDPLNVVHR